MYDICFVTTPINELTNDRLEPPMGYLYLATYLEEKSTFTSKIYDICSIPKEKWDFPEARLYGFSTYTPVYHRTLEIKEMIRNKYPKACFIAGGAHATALPDNVKEDFDYVVLGEGEKALYDILERNKPFGIYIGQPITDLDDLPFINYDFVDVTSYSRIVGGKHAI